MRLVQKLGQVTEGNPISPNLIEIKEEKLEGLAGFEPATCGLGNPNSRSQMMARLFPSLL